MGEYSRAEAADRAGVEGAYVDRLIELGILAPDASDQLTKGDVRRAQLAQTLEGAGITLDGVAAGIRDGSLSLAFMDHPAYDRFAILSNETFEGLAERTGLPLDLLMLIREATGAGVPDPGDRVREDELAVVPVIEAGLAIGFRPVSLARRLRVLGDAMRRVAETSQDAFRKDLAEPMFAAGATANELHAMSMSDDTVRVDETMDEAVLAIWNAHQVRAWTTDLVTVLEKSLAEAGLQTPVRRPPAICFLDITGYTRLTHERGDAAAGDLAEELGALVTRTAVGHGGRPVKWLGDGVMVYFPDPGLGVLAALDMVDGVVANGLPPAHVGLHAGSVLSQGGDYFGETVNLASRIADYARPGEVLVTQAVVDANTESRVTFSEIGPVELKGISAIVALYSAHRS